MFKKQVYIKNSLKPFKLSRTKIDLYFDCQRCFFIDQKYGIRRPHGTPLVINNRFVEKLKIELNECREEQKCHPEILNLNRNYIPLKHQNLREWTTPFKGISFFHENTNILLYGIIDDVLLDKNKMKNHSLIIKSTSKKNKINYEDIWQGYWKQLSYYSFLLERNNIEMSKMGVLIYINAYDDLNSSNQNVKFELSLFERLLDDSWIEPTILNIYNILNSEKVPNYSTKCKFCRYYFKLKEKIDE